MIIEAFSKTYQNRTVLAFPGGEFQSGHIYAVLGPNGSGKSTFASVLSGIIPSDQGRPVISRRKIGYLPQHPYPFHLTVRKNLLLNGEGTREEKRQRSGKLLEALSLSSLSSKSAASLSGGETKRMALARLFMKSYDIVILDEPCASMDIRSTRQAEDLIRAYQAENHTVMFLITHSINQAVRLTDEYLFLKEGQLLASGKTASLLQNFAGRELKEFLEFQ